MSKRITIHYDDKPIYDIVIENDYMSLADEIRAIGLDGRKICVVSDSNVAPLYLDDLTNKLSKIGKIFSYTFNAGEESKTLETVENLYEYLILNHFERRDILVALGGGVVGDLTGYAAATYLRGIDFIQVPTSLLAQVDSSIGGKTGVDFRSYKNMVGAFHMPRLVYMNLKVLDTLDDRLFNSGFGEIIKHGYIKNAEYLDYIENNISGIKAREYDVMEHIIYESCLIKAGVVERDPHEKGERALLNFGHTLGHSIEKLCNFSKYHGECVVLGMICALDICVNRNLISSDDYDRAIKLFAAFGFPLTITGIAAEEVIKVSKSDKKMENGSIKFCLLRGVGMGYIDRTVTDEECLKALEKVLR